MPDPIVEARLSTFLGPHGPTDPVDLVIAEGDEFLYRLSPKVQSQPMSGLAALAFGLLRAIAACPECGQFRHFFERGGHEYMSCRHCEMAWMRIEEVSGE